MGVVKLYVDPGLRACGAALFDGDTLMGAALPEGVEGDMRHAPARARVFTKMAEAVKRWGLDLSFACGKPLDGMAVELPQIYPRGHQLAPKAGTDLNDLIHLAGVVGALAGTVAPTETILLLPAEWKGQLPKKIMHARALARLSVAEQARIPKLAKSKLHNVLDAVCMGLVDVGRLASVHRY